MPTFKTLELRGLGAQSSVKQLFGLEAMCGSAVAWRTVGLAIDQALAKIALIDLLDRFIDSLD
ncbi:hypothetical protein D3C77_684250 [compost metagenome]